jgi:hypothetical protein
LDFGRSFDASHVLVVMDCVAKTMWRHVSLAFAQQFAGKLPHATAFAGSG